MKSASSKSGFSTQIREGSQQLQGEVQELELEDLLQAKFPTDVVGACPQRRIRRRRAPARDDSAGQECGTILWETKRTKNWSDGWIAKLREDKRQAQADLALLVSHAVPKGMSSFDLIDGVWVAEDRRAIPVAIALRQSIIELAGARLAAEGQQSKMEMIYDYLTGPRFRHRIEAIVEKFTDMQEDLDKERKVMVKLWLSARARSEASSQATAGMYGDVQGIAGRLCRKSRLWTCDCLPRPPKRPK